MARRRRKKMLKCFGWKNIGALKKMKPGSKQNPLILLTFKSLNAWCEVGGVCVCVRERERERESWPVSVACYGSQEWRNLSSNCFSIFPFSLSFCSPSHTHCHWQSLSLSLSLSLLDNTLSYEQNFCSSRQKQLFVILVFEQTETF